MRALSWVIATAMSLGFAYVVAKVTGDFIEQSFAEAARNIEQMGVRK